MEDAIETFVRLLFAIEQPENEALFPTTTTPEERQGLLRLVWTGHLLALAELFAFIFDLLVVVSLFAMNDWTSKAIGMAILFGMIVAYYATHVGGRRVDQGGVYTGISFFLQEHLLGRARADIWTTIALTEFCIFCFEDVTFLLADFFELLLPDDNLIQTISQYIKFTRVSLGLGVVIYFAVVVTLNSNSCGKILVCCRASSNGWLRLMLWAPQIDAPEQTGKKDPIARILRVFIPLLLAGCIFLGLHSLGSLENNADDPEQAFWVGYSVSSVIGLLALVYLRFLPASKDTQVGLSKDQIGLEIQIILEKAHLDAEANYSQVELEKTGLGLPMFKSFMKAFANDMVKRQQPETGTENPYNIAPAAGLYAKRLRHEITLRVYSALPAVSESESSAERVKRAREFVDPMLSQAARELFEEHGDSIRNDGDNGNHRYWIILATDPKAHTMNGVRAGYLELSGLVDVPDWVQYDFEQYEF